MKRIDPAKVQAAIGTMYPPPYHTPCLDRARRKLGDAAGLTQFGVVLTRLAPGTWSSQRHWHSHEDEFVYIVEGEVVLVTNAGEETLKAGDAAGFKGGIADGHCLQNRSSREAVILEVGSRHEDDRCTYPDIDLLAPAHEQPAMYTHRDGSPYQDLRRREPGE